MALFQKKSGRLIKERKKLENVYEGVIETEVKC